MVTAIDEALEHFLQIALYSFLSDCSLQQQELFHFYF